MANDGFLVEFKAKEPEDGKDTLFHKSQETKDFNQLVKACQNADIGKYDKSDGVIKITSKDEYDALLDLAIGDSSMDVDELRDLYVVDVNDEAKRQLGITDRDTTEWDNGDVTDNDKAMLNQVEKADGQNNTEDDMDQAPITTDDGSFGFPTFSEDDGVISDSTASQTPYEEPNINQEDTSYEQEQINPAIDNPNDEERVDSSNEAMDDRQYEENGFENQEPDDNGQVDILFSLNPIVDTPPEVIHQTFSSTGTVYGDWETANTVADEMMDIIHKARKDSEELADVS